jgi:hypothetical protein
MASARYANGTQAVSLWNAPTLFLQSAPTSTQHRHRHSKAKASIDSPTLGLDGDRHYDIAGGGIDLLVAPVRETEEKTATIAPANGERRQCHKPLAENA